MRYLTPKWLWLVACVSASSFASGGSTSTKSHSCIENNTVFLAGVAAWQSASGKLRSPIDILISDGKIVETGAELRTSGRCVRTIEGTGLFVLGNIAAGAKANLVLLDTDPSADVNVLANTADHVRIVFNEGVLLSDGPIEQVDIEPVPDDRHVPSRPLVATADWGSIGFGGIITMDSLGIRQDDASEQQLGEIEKTGAGVSGVRFGFFGHLGEDYRVTYYTDIGYNGFAEGFDIQNEDEYSLYNLEIGFPRTPIGTFTVGRMKPPGTISRLWAGAYMPISGRQAPVSALTKSRDDGIRLADTAFSKRMTWAVSLSNDWLNEDVSSMDDASTYLSARVTGLLLEDSANDHLLHVGLTGRFTDFASDTIRFRSKPGVPFVPDFLDTGEMPGDAARWLTADFAYRKDRLLVSGEYIRTDLDSPLIADPGFTGSYVWAEWSLTGEVRNYNADKGVFTRPLPAHDFSMGGMGAWSLAFAVNDTDLNEGTIDGGDMQQVSIGINWYPEKSYRWGLEFSRIWLDRMGLESETDVAHLFLHVSNL